MILHKEHRCNYTQIDNDMLSDVRISWKSKGLLCYLLSKPEGWNVVQEDIVRRATDGYNKVRSAMKELRKAGYITEEFPRDSSGRITARTLTVREVPLCRDALDEGNH